MARILVADDSLTIQKVVSITLSSLPFQLVQAKSEMELVSALKTDKFDLILLDFSLVDKKSGYELGKDIRKCGYKGPILTMVGTFDSIDDFKLKDCGINDFITKPFESEKFINKCQNLLSESGKNTVSSEISDSVSIEVSSESEISIESELKEDDSSWVINAAHEKSGVREIDLSQLDDSNTTNNVSSIHSKLRDDLDGWGVAIPDIIGKNKEEVALPPKLPEKKPAFQSLEPESDDSFDGDIKENKVKGTDVFQITDFLDNEKLEKGKEVNLEDFKLPTSQDLEYPDFDLAPKKEESKPVAGPKSKLIPLTELADEHEDTDSTDPAFELPSGINEKLLEHIESDVDPSEFWAADSNSAKAKQDNVKVVASGSSGIAWSLEDHVEHNEKHETKSSTQTSQINEDELVQKIMAKLSPLLEQKLKEYCKTSVEKIAWEVIPDLAENLIKEEIKKIESSNNLS